MTFNSFFISRFSYCCGKNIVLDSCNTTAFRCKSYSNGLVFSAQPLESDEHFEVGNRIIIAFSLLIIFFAFFLLNKDLDFYGSNV